MQQPGPPDINLTVAAWADIVLKIWREKLIEQRIYDSGDLFNSLKYEIERNANGNPQKIEFAYNYYGMFTDAGTVNIKQREWKNKTLYGQVMKLREIITGKYIDAVKNGVIVSMMPENQ